MAHGDAIQRTGRAGQTAGEREAARQPVDRAASEANARIAALEGVTQKQAQEIAGLTQRLATAEALLNQVAAVLKPPGADMVWECPASAVPGWYATGSCS